MKPKQFRDQPSHSEAISINILMIEDNEDDAFFIHRHLENEGWRVSYRRAQSKNEMIYALKNEDFDIVLSDHSLPGFDSIGALETLQQHGIDIPFILVTGSIGGEQAAVDIMRAGANDFIPKSRLGTLAPAIVRELNDAETRRSKQEAEENLVQRNRELEESLRTVTQIQDQLMRVGRQKGLGEMAAGVAHDFNNALTKIIGVAEIALEKNKDSAVGEYLDKIKFSAEDGASIVRRLRDFYRMGPDMALGEAIDLAKIVEESILLSQPKWKAEREASGTHIELEVELSDLPPVLGNSSEFREAVTNIIFNACDAMPDGGTLRITSAVDSGVARLHFTDNGTGMTDEVKQRCLDPFFSTKGEMGSGLGLPLVDGLLQKLGSTLRIESKEGEGSTVTLNFSTYEGENDQDRNGHELESIGQMPRLKVLVIDDEPEICVLIQRLLLLDGHEVHAFKDGNEALAFIEGQKFDMVICDRAMPSIGGDEIAFRMSEMTKSCPFIMISGFGDLMIAKDDVPEGVDLVLPKPVSRNTLRRALYQASRRNHPRLEHGMDPDISGAETELISLPA